MRGAVRAGADEIVAVDCHGAGGDWTFNSFVPELLDDNCTWVAHHPWARYTELLEQGADACLLVGMHARNNTADGVLSHTISTVKWHNLWFNDDLVGESGVNAALCGHYGCPVLLVTGDEAVCREVTGLLGDGLTTVAVKQWIYALLGASDYAAGGARNMIEDGAYQALQNLAAVEPYVPSSPVTITIEVDKVERMADFMGRPGVELDRAAQKVYSRADDWMTAWNQIWHWTV